MSTVLKPERIRADEIKVGDLVSRTKGGGGYNEVIAVIPTEETIWLHLKLPWGMYRLRPKKETKLWVLRNQA